MRMSDKLFFSIHKLVIHPTKLDNTQSWNLSSYASVLYTMAGSPYHRLYSVVPTSGFMKTLQHTSCKHYSNMVYGKLISDCSSNNIFKIKNIDNFNPILAAGPLKYSHRIKKLKMMKLKRKENL